MDGLQFALIAVLVVVALGSGSTFLVPVAIFVYSRLRSGGSVGVPEGATAYVSILIGVSAIALTIAVGALFTAIIGEADGNYTYGESMYGDGMEYNDGMGFFDDSYDRQRDQDLALALGVGIAGALSLILHLAIRRWLQLRSLFAPPVERGWDLFLAVGLGLAAFLLLAQMLQGTFDRWLVDQSGASPGDTIAQFFAFLLLWAAYASRAYRHLLTSPGDGGPAPAP